MGVKRVVLSLLLGVAGGLSAYFLAWGLFTTHAELGMEPGKERMIALWVAPIVFLASLIYFAARSPRR